MKLFKQEIGTGALVVVAAVFCMPATAQDLYVYAGKGQSDEQLAEDRYACHRWAVGESNFDPIQFDEVAPPRTVKVQTPRNEAAGTTGKAAIAGAVAGGVIGSHDGDAAKGAVIGAVVGTIAGAAIEGQGQKEAREKAQAEADRQVQDLQRTRAEKALRRSNYRRALTACLEGRGYTVR